MANNTSLNPANKAVQLLNFVYLKISWESWKQLFYNQKHRSQQKKQYKYTTWKIYGL